MTVSRTVVQIDPKFHPDGERFLIKPYPKDKEYRRVKLSEQLAGKITTHITHNSSATMTCFSPCARKKIPIAGCGYSPTRPPRLHRAERRRPPVPARNPQRLQRRQMPMQILQRRLRPLPRRPPGGRERPAPPAATLDTDGHIPRDWFRLNVWKPALKKAGISL